MLGCYTIPPTILTPHVLSEWMVEVCRFDEYVVFGILGLSWCIGISGLELVGNYIRSLKYVGFRCLSVWKVLSVLVIDVRCYIVLHYYILLYTIIHIIYYIIIILYLILLYT